MLKRSVLLFSAFMTGGAAHAQSIMDMDEAGDGIITTTGVQPGTNKYYTPYDVIDDNIIYDYETNGDGINNPQKVTGSNFSYKGTAGLLYGVVSPSTPGALQRTEHSWEKSSVPFSGVRYYGFAVRNSGTNTPSDVTIFAQWWQGSQLSPPVSFNITNGNRQSYGLVIRNDDANNIRARDGTGPGAILVDTGSLPIGVWKEFIVKIDCDPTGNNGSLQVWVDNAPTATPTHSYTGKLCYSPGYNAALTDLRFKTGIYRPAQGNVQRGNFQLAFDEIKAGSSRTAVDP
jgi:hypothetical protein